MITKVQKYLIFGVKEDLDLFYERAQAAGFIEFISQKKPLKHLPEFIQNFVFAIKTLKTLPQIPQSKEPIKKEKAGVLANRIVEIKEKISSFQEDKRILEAEKARIAPFGDFSLEEVKYFEEKSHYKMQFFCAKAGKARDLLSNDDLIYIGTESELDYFIAINPHVKLYPELTEMRLDCSLGDIIHQISSVENKIHLMEKELKGLAQYIDVLNDEMIDRLNVYHLEMAKEEATAPSDDMSVFSAEAWIPNSKINSVMTLLEGLAVHCEKIAIEEDDRIPTVMENKGSGKIGEDLISFYDIPSITDKDPSRWVFWSFAFFFAIIIADGGYGLLFLGLAAYLKYKWRTFKGASKRLFRLFVVLSSFVVIWGVITCSFFGLQLSSKNILKEMSPFNYLVEAKADYHMHQKDDVYKEYVEQVPAVSQAQTGKQLLEAVPSARGDFSDSILLDFTLIVGIVHISLALLRYVRRNIAGLGWVCFLVGAYFYFPMMLNATTLANILGLLDKVAAHALGEKLVYIGFGSAVLLGIVQKGWKGILELMNIIQISADVLSYLRLYALALASSIMAATFNGMGEAAGLAGGFLIVVVGHATNLSLGTMSGVIHGLRLNFIEWYRYSFEGGGRLFNPLRILRSKEE